jgi:hypothetical protein
MIKKHTTYLLISHHFTNLRLRLPKETFAQNPYKYTENQQLQEMRLP